MKTRTLNLITFILLSALFISCGVNQDTYDAKLPYITSSDCGEGYLTVQVSNGKWQIKDNSGKEIATYDADTLGCLFPKTMSNYIIIGKGGKFGIVDPINNKELVECKYLGPVGYFLYTSNSQTFQGFTFSKDTIYVSKTNGEVFSSHDAFMNRFGSKTNEFAFSSSYDNYWFDANSSSFVVEKNKKWGVVDAKNKIILPIEFDAINGFSKDKLCAVEKNGKVGFYDLKGSNILPFKYKAEYIGANTSWVQFNDGLCPVTKDGISWGYVNKSGKEVIPFKFKTAMPFSEGLAFVGNKDKKYGIMNTEGKMVTGFDFDWSWTDSPHMWGAIVYENGLINFDDITLNKKGEIVKKK